MIGETADMDILQRFARRPPVVGGVVHAARSAAVCGAHGTEVLRTRDRDFSSDARSRLAGALGPGARQSRAVGAPWRGAACFEAPGPAASRLTGFEAVRTLRRVGGWPNNRRAPSNRTLKGTPQ